MTRIQRVASLAALALTFSCAGPDDARLERVAKDWCLTIRASQVIPVYPLTEDVQPGDVYLVPQPIALQHELYEEKGFLPLDQLITRIEMPAASFQRFYGPSYFGEIAGLPTPRPGWDGDEAAVRLPMAAFPTYAFEVNRSAGLGLALPVQGIPVGMSLMGASRASGSIAINDAYSYGTSTQVIYGRLADWWESGSDRMRAALTAMAAATAQGGGEDGVYLRIVTRVFLTKELGVSLENLDASSFGLDVGASPEIELIDLSLRDPDEAKEVAEAYAAARDAISPPPAAGGPAPDAAAGDLEGLGAAAQALNAGGGLRFVQVSRRAVSLEESFLRPLVIGYTGFDVQVLPNGELSAPIPTFSVVSGTARVADFAAVPPRTPVQSRTSAAFARWLDDLDNARRVRAWLDERDVDLAVADLRHPSDPAAIALMHTLIELFDVPTEDD